MNRKIGIAIALVLACAIVVGIYVQQTPRHTATPQPTPTRADAGGASPRMGTHSASAPGRAGDRKQVGESSDGGNAHLAPPGEAAVAALGPAPLSAENIGRVAKFAEGLAAGNERQKEFLHLATHEELDPEWSPQMQDALGRALRERQGGRTGLEIGEPRCTRSICTISAVPYRNVLDDTNDWQALMVEVMNEPWFQEHFFDASTTMGSDDRGLIYLTYFVRKNAD